MLMGCLESNMLSKSLANTVPCISGISKGLFYQMKPANMSHMMTGSRSFSMLPLPRNLYKSRLSTTSPMQSQFSSKFSTTYRIISGIKLQWGEGGCFLSLQVCKLINQSSRISLREIIVLSHYLLIFNFFKITFHYSQDLDFGPSPWPKRHTLSFGRWKVKIPFSWKAVRSTFTLVTPPSVLHSLFAQQDQIRLTGCTRVATNLIFT